jgi:hypothetical protein
LQKSLFVAVNASSRWLNPNPGGLVANMTSKTQNCCDKSLLFIKEKKLEKCVILHKCLVFNFVKASFYQNDALFDYSI